MTEVKVGISTSVNMIFGEEATGIYKRASKLTPDVIDEIINTGHTYHSEFNSHEEAEAFVLGVRLGLGFNDAIRISGKDYEKIEKRK